MIAEYIENHDFLEKIKLMMYSSVSDVTLFRYHYYKLYFNSGYASRPAADFLPTCRVLAV